MLPSQTRSLPAPTALMMPHIMTLTGCFSRGAVGDFDVGDRHILLGLTAEHSKADSSLKATWKRKKLTLNIEITIFKAFIANRFPVLPFASFRMSNLSVQVQIEVSFVSWLLLELGLFWPFWIRSSLV